MSARSALLSRAAKRRRTARAPALLEVLLVVVLCLVERLRRRDLRHDRTRPVALLTLLRRVGGCALLLVVDEHHAAVVVADVPALPIQLCRVVLVPEDVQQLVVGDYLGVAGRVRAHVLVGRIVERPARIADARLRDAVELAERGFDAPETAGAERCGLHHYSSSSFNAAELMQYRRPVGCGPSGNTCPRWPPHDAHSTSVRTIP